MGTWGRRTDPVPAAPARVRAAGCPHRASTLPPPQGTPSSACPGLGPPGGHIGRAETAPTPTRQPRRTAWPRCRARGWLSGPLGTSPGPCSTPAAWAPASACRRPLAACPPVLLACPEPTACVGSGLAWVPGSWGAAGGCPPGAALAEGAGGSRSAQLGAEGPGPTPPRALLPLEPPVRQLTQPRPPPAQGTRQGTARARPSCLETGSYRPRRRLPFWVPGAGAAVRGCDGRPGASAWQPRAPVSTAPPPHLWLSPHKWARRTGSRVQPTPAPPVPGGPWAPPVERRGLGAEAVPEEASGPLLAGGARAAAALCPQPCLSGRLPPHASPARPVPFISVLPDHPVVWEQRNLPSPTTNFFSLKALSGSGVKQSLSGFQRGAEGEAARNEAFGGGR
ncbi:uncharacterized protein AAEQ78_025931 [Lycaon pictus]